VYWNDLAWAIRRAVGIVQAFEILSKAVEKFPEDAMTNFNLGCYLCQMGEIEKAKEHVGKAIKLDRHFRILALEDVDFGTIVEGMGTIIKTLAQMPSEYTHMEHT
jgi:tetratricopeptide (TPR) repeat protein